MRTPLLFLLLAIPYVRGFNDPYTTAKNMYNSIVSNPSPPTVPYTNSIGYLGDSGILVWSLYSGADGLERQTWVVGPRNAQIKPGGSQYNPADHIPDGSTFIAWNKTAGWLAIGVDAKLDCVNVTKYDNSNYWVKRQYGTFTNVCKYRLLSSMEASWSRALPMYYSRLDGTLLGSYPGIPFDPNFVQEFNAFSPYIAAIPVASSISILSSSFAVDTSSNTTFHMEVYNYNKVVQQDGIPGQLFSGVYARANACPSLDPSIPNRATFTTTGFIFLPDYAFMNGDDLIAQATNASGISFIVTLDPGNIYYNQGFSTSGIDGPSSIVSGAGGPASYFYGEHFVDDFVWFVNGTNQPLNLPFVSQEIPAGSPGGFLAEDAVNPTPIICPWGQRFVFSYQDTHNPFDPYSGVSCSCVPY